MMKEVLAMLGIMAIAIALMACFMSVCDHIRDTKDSLKRIEDKLWERK